MFDLIISGAEIIDGSGRRAFRADVGVRGGRIVALGEMRGRASVRIRANGMIVAPGFIDIHSHSDYHLLVNPLAESKIRQGVTTEVGGNCGYSAAPVSDEVARERRKSFPASFGITHRWRTVFEYLSRLEEQGISVNFALLCGHNTVRASVMGGRRGLPGTSGYRKIRSLFESSLDEGAVGISTGLAYAPACFAGLPELVQLGKLARERGVIFSAHIRSEGDRLLESLDEFLAVGNESGASLEISHLKTLGRNNWWKLDSAFDRIEQARKNGVAVSADRYPYTAANTSLASLLPNWALVGNPETVRARFDNPRTVKRLVRDLHTSHPDTAFWRNVVVSQVLKKANRKWEGMDIATAADGEDPAVFAVELLRRDRLASSVHVFSMSEENLERILKKPWIMIGSDSAVRSRKGPLRLGFPHPRAFGTFPRVLEKCVRGRKLMTLERAIHKMTGMPARKVGLSDRGRIRIGCWADLVVFSPDSIADRSLFRNPYRYPAGIEYVVVNGRIVIDRGRHTGERPGKVIRGKDIRPYHGS